MPTIGLIGGMSWESSLEYYRIINESVKRRLGGLHSASCLIRSLDFAPLERLRSRCGLDVLVPSAADREAVHRIVYDELSIGTIRAESRAQFCRIIGSLASAGTEGVILGCMGIGLLVTEADPPIPLCDTTRLYAEAAVEWALG